MIKIYTVIISFMFLFLNISSAQTILYEETFSGGTLDNPWYPGFGGVSNTMGVKSFQSPSGDNWVGSMDNFVFSNDTLVNTLSMSFSGNDNLTDFYYEAQIYVETDSAFYYGLEFRIDSTGESSGYNFVVQANPNFGPGRIRFRRRDGSSPSDIVSIKDWNSFEIPGVIPTTNGWHKMAVETIGNQFRLFFDDQELPGGPYTDSTYTSGFVGAYIFHFDTVETHQLKIDDILVTSEATAIGDNSNSIISNFDLYQNYPNPFNPSTTISFELPSSENIRLDIFNNIGQKVRTLVNGQMSAGRHLVSWDARNDLANEVPAGVYYYQLTANDFQQTRKMLLVK